MLCEIFGLFDDYATIGFFGHYFLALAFVVTILDIVILIQGRIGKGMCNRLVK